jgi:hypothetical protein
MAGKNNFISQVIGLVMNYEKMTGGMSERGLASKETVVESAGTP